MAPPRQPQHLVQLEAVAAGYGEPVLRDVDLLISAGDRIGLLGVNGAGKSTLVKALADGSTVLSGSRTVSRDTRIGYFAQHQLDQLDPPAADRPPAAPRWPASRSCAATSAASASAASGYSSRLPRFLAARKPAWCWL
jgi:ATP-binding cassette subfamily F protein 3